MGCGTRWICHSVWKETKDWQNEKDISKLVPDLPAQADKVLTGLMDFTAAYIYDGQDRVLVIDGDERVIAGHRMESHFRTPKGRRIKEIYMGTSPEEAYENLQSAFHNKQRYVTVAEMKKKGGSSK
jgi:hypothetical protein